MTKREITDTESGKPTAQELDAIIWAMNRVHGKDIAPFDSRFLAKAVQNRMDLTRVDSPEAYGKYLSSNAVEAEAFSRSLIITYSEFFRNLLTFALLEQLVLPSLTEKAGHSEIRIWSAGCAAGQEAYSIAMLLEEISAARGGGVAFRIFATDITASLLSEGRRGRYDWAAVQNVRAKHLRNYFLSDGETYELVSRLRKRVDFSFYDLLDESAISPPASIYGEFDLVMCCNLLFYYRAEPRRLILEKVYRSLAMGGYLITGEAERGLVEKTKGFRALYPSSAVFQKF